jgi:hypothetical protein
MLKTLLICWGIWHSSGVAMDFKDKEAPSMDIPNNLPTCLKQPQEPEVPFPHSQEITDLSSPKKLKKFYRDICNQLLQQYGQQCGLLPISKNNHEDIQ